MAAEYHTIDLTRLGLSAGEGRRLEGEVAIGDLELAGQRYETGSETDPVRLDVSRTASGHAFRLVFETEVSGPCMRCLEGAAQPVRVEAREVDQPGGGEEMRCPYVDDEVLDLAAWARDALVLALPPQILCRDDCAGLCPVCGASLNDADPAEHEHADSRGGPFAKLSELPRE